MTRQQYHVTSSQHDQARRLEIGSVFGAVSEHYLGKEKQPIPWDTDGTTAYVGSGRQGLALLERELCHSGIHTLLVPQYLCDSMIEPFVVKEWRIIPVSVTEDLRIDLADLFLHAERAVEPTAALMAEYFGRRPSPEYRTAVGRLQTLGIPVVDDETHRVLTPGGTVAEYSVASLRKCLPLADGGYVRGLSSNEMDLADPSPAVEKAWMAMDDLAQAEEGQSTQTARASVAQAIDQFEDDLLPRRISSRSLRTLETLTYEKLAEQRRANFDALERLLDGQFCMLQGLDSVVPSHGVIRIPHAREVQRHMAEQGVYCPIHWGPAKLLEDVASWPDDILSLPIDHRYGLDHMRYIARALQEVA